MKMIIAIDGPAGSGKSTVAERVAKELGLGYLNTGAMYRALALKSIRTGSTDESSVVSLLDSSDIEPTGRGVSLDGEDVTDHVGTPEVSAAASRVARIPEVRTWMVDRQRAVALDFAEGVVVEGRDIGTVVFPDASVKVYLDAHPEVRARRRSEQDGGAGDEAFERTLQAVRKRDERDMTRAVNPLSTAPDATILDTTDLGVDEVVDAIVDLARKAGEHA